MLEGLSKSSATLIQTLVRTCKREVENGCLTSDTLKTNLQILLPTFHKLWNNTPAFHQTKSPCQLLDLVTTNHFGLN